MTTWGVDADEICVANREQKREAFSEYLNGDFDKDTGGKKHHSPIGIRSDGRVNGLRSVSSYRER